MKEFIEQEQQRYGPISQSQELANLCDLGVKARPARLQRILDSSTRLDHLIQDAFAYTTVAESSPVKLRPINIAARIVSFSFITYNS